MGEKYIKWDFTGKCNLRCRHCSVGKQYFSGEVLEISREEKLAVVENLATGGVQGISFLGGEPLLLDGDFFDVVARATELGMKTTLVTNGTLLEPSTWGRLLDAGIGQVVVSLDGASEETHEFIRGKSTFHKVTQNLRGFAGYLAVHNPEVRLKINTVLNRKNLPEVSVMLDFCRSLQVDEWTLLSLGGVGYAEDNMEQMGLSPKEEIEAARVLAQAYASLGPDPALTISPQFAYPLVWDYIEKQYGFSMPRTRVCCNAAINLGFIGPDGSLYPCDRIANKEYLGERIGGAEIRPMSLLTTPFYEIWNSDYFVNMFNFILEEKTYSGYQPCNHCKYLKNRSCNPCPLYSLSSKVLINTCIIAEKALGDISGGEENPFVQPGNPRPAPGGQPGAAQPYLGHEIPVQQSGVRFFAKGEYGILLSPYSVDFLGLNLMGSEVWRLIDGENSVRTIMGHLEQLAVDVQKRIAPDQADHGLQELVQQNVQAFLHELSCAGLIRFPDS